MSDSLFDDPSEFHKPDPQFDEVDLAAPLAARMRPRSLEEFSGQENIVGEGTLLRKAILQDHLTSVIFWGPPGCGKSTLAQIIARATKAKFESFSAVTSGVADLRKVIEQAKDRKRKLKQKTIIGHGAGGCASPIHIRAAV